MAGSKIKKNDTVKVIAGKDKGKTGKAISVTDKKIIVEGINIVKKAMKRKSQEAQGGIIEVEAALDISNVQVVSKGEVTRVGYKKNQDGKKTRIAKKTGEDL